MNKKIVSLALAAVLSTSPLVGASAASTPYVKSDTTMDFVIQQGATYQFKLTPINTTAAPIVTTANNSIIQVVSSKKVGNNYFVKIKATGAAGDCVGVYTRLNLKGQTAKRQLVVTIASQNSNSSSSSVSSSVSSRSPQKPGSTSSKSSSSSSSKSSSSSSNTSSSTKISGSKEGLYGIVELSSYSNKVITETGLLEPIRKSYSSSYSFDQNASNVNYNMNGCDLINGGFVISGDGTGAIANFIEKDGKFGIKINMWRKSKSDNSQAGVLNGVLSAMVYLSDKTTGESLWAWLDAFSINKGHIDTKSYGFVDNSDGTITYKGGNRKIKVIFNTSDITLLFNV